MIFQSNFYDKNDRIRTRQIYKFYNSNIDAKLKSCFFSISLRRIFRFYMDVNLSMCKCVYVTVVGFFRNSVHPTVQYWNLSFLGWWLALLPLLLSKDILLINIHIEKRQWKKLLLCSILHLCTVCVQTTAAAAAATAVVPGYDTMNETEKNTT